MTRLFEFYESIKFPCIIVLQNSWRLQFYNPLKGLAIVFSRCAQEISSNIWYSYLLAIKIDSKKTQIHCMRRYCTHVLYFVNQRRVSQVEYADKNLFFIWIPLYLLHFLWRVSHCFVYVHGQVKIWFTRIIRSDSE